VSIQRKNYLLKQQLSIFYVRRYHVMDTPERASRQVAQLVRELPLKRECAEFLVVINWQHCSTGATGRHNRKPKLPMFVARAPSAPHSASADKVVNAT
jgi:hypothetical protein